MQHTFGAGWLVVMGVLGLAAGLYGRKLWQHNDDVKSLKTRLENARRARRWALVLAAVVGFWLFAVIWHWVVTVNKG